MVDEGVTVPANSISLCLWITLNYHFSSVATEVFSWGSGANYQLGTGNTHIQKLPCKVDALHGSFVKLVSAAKFHSAAVSASGEVYTWGFGRGGRLGHPEFDIHRYSVKNLTLISTGIIIIIIMLELVKMTSSFLVLFFQLIVISLKLVCINNQVHFILLFSVAKLQLSLPVR
jgi:alpha-tubulin suppressor-like RCC1 family protein